MYQALEKVQTILFGARFVTAAAAITGGILSVVFPPAGIPLAGAALGTMIGLTIRFAKNSYEQNNIMNEAQKKKTADQIARLTKEVFHEYKALIAALNQNDNSTASLDLTKLTNFLNNCKEY